MHSLILLFLLTSFSLNDRSSAIPTHRPPLITTLSSSQAASFSPCSSQVTSSSVQVGLDTTPRVFFEVTKPIQHPKITPCSNHILQHDFAHTYGRPPATVSYTPPSQSTCGKSTHFSTIILEFSATCQGRQFDRILGVWLGGVELLRSSTAEPTRDGISWKVQKDVSRYSSLLLAPKNQTLAVYLGNVVDSIYTGIYHVNVTFHYYPAEQTSENNGIRVKKGGTLYRDWADLILPISRNLPLNDGLWFQIEDFTQVKSKRLVIPQNVYRAVLEIYVSYHENDEFWDSNLPNDYLIANNLTSKIGNGNGNFREVLVSLDGELVGAVCPFTVIFTGGINPLLWRPISAIGSFNLPSYDIEITPFLGKLLDGKPHSFGFTVTNSLNVWFVDANLHLWVDGKRSSTKGQLLENNASPLAMKSRSNFVGLNGEFFTGATRFIKSAGWVDSSYGNITTTSTQKFDFQNSMVLRNNGSLQIVERTINFNTSVSAKMQSSCAFYMIESHKRFPMFYYGNQSNEKDQQGYTLVSNVTLGLNEDEKCESESELSSSSLRNEQRGDGIMVVKNNLVDSAVAGMHQVYDYNENNGKLCYFRNISSYNYTILHDETRDKCESAYRNYTSV